MFTYFTDRDGKFQLCALAESAFDPLARTTQFMLTEEAHHMFVGESGVARMLQRTAEVMRERATDDPQAVRAAGAIDLPTLQRYLNFHYSVTIDLFGADQSSNAATFYSAGLKGRFEESKRDDDHLLKGATYPILENVDGKLVERDVPMLNALNEVLRDDFIRDSVARHRALEQGAGEERRRVAPGHAAQGVQPQDRLPRRAAREPRGPRRQRVRMAGDASASGCRRRKTARSSRR